MEFVNLFGKHMTVEKFCKSEMIN